jgi:hypothetical protein
MPSEPKTAIVLDNSDKALALSRHLYGPDVMVLSYFGMVFGRQFHTIFARMPDADYPEYDKAREWFEKVLYLRLAPGGKWIWI